MRLKIAIKFSDEYLLNGHSILLFFKQMINHVPPRTKFTQNEDRMLVKLVNEMENVNWKSIASKMNGRTPRQCRERYNNYLSPSLRLDPWNPDEDALLIRKYNEYGPQWAFLSRFFNNRGPVNLKNHYAKLSYQSNKLLQEMKNNNLYRINDKNNNKDNKKKINDQEDHKEIQDDRENDIFFSNDYVSGLFDNTQFYSNGQDLDLLTFIDF